MRNDQIIFDLISKEDKRQREGIELIASENFVSNDVMRAMGSCLTNKYAEGFPGSRYYGGCEIVDQVEQLAIDRAKELFGVEYVNVQPHSGSQANSAVMLACLKPGDYMLGFNISHCGQLTHGAPVNFSGKLYKTSFYNVDESTGKIDYDKLEEVAILEKPKLIICGASAYSQDWDYARFREISDKTGALLLGDIAHPAGLIAAKLLNDPVPYCHILTTTTHKTLRGPRGGMIMMGEDFENPWGLKSPKGNIRMMSAILNSGVFPGSQGGPLEHVIAAKAIAFGEALKPEFRSYGEQVIENAKIMASEFIQRGYMIISGGTENHCMLIDLRNKNITGKDAENALVKADITANKNMVPFDSRSPFVTSGIRFGTPAITTRGIKGNIIPVIVDLIDKVIINYKDEKVLSHVKNEVNTLMRDYPVFS